MGKSIRGCVVGIADAADFRERKSLSAMQKVLTDCRSSQISGNYMELLKLLFEVRSAEIMEWIFPLLSQRRFFLKVFQD